MRRNEYTITVKNGYFGNTAISAVRLDNNISVYHFTLSGKDVFPGCTYQVQYERPDGVSAIAVPETQSFGLDGTLTLDWIPSGDMFAVSGTGKIKLYAVDADGTQMWNSHLADYHVCETLDPSDNTSIAIPPDELATYVAKAVESARKASDSEANAKTAETRASEYAESASANATSASASATNASASEVNAKSSETNASASASSASASAETATEQATIATTKAQEALASATSAEQAATSAADNLATIQTALDGKANVSHTHTIADVTGLQSALDRKTDKPTWADLAIKSNQGDFAVQYDFGDQFSDTWVDKSASKSYDFVWDYVHKRDVTLSDGETLTARPFLQMHYTTPYGVQFSHQRALTAVMYKTTSALVKGTGYNFKMADGRYLNFTCPEAVEAGVWLGYNNGNIEVYNATGLNKSSEASASISATASGTSLGNAPSMPAGTYSFVFASNWGSNVVAGKAVSFTIPSALSFGDRICGLYGAPDNSPSSWKVYTVTDSGKTLSDPIAVTVSDDGAGTSLGTMGYSARVASQSFPLNSIQEVAYGWNRWKTSAARQYWNSEAGVDAWWKAQDAFDIRPNELSIKPGFLSGFPAEFLNAIKRVEVKTFANTVNDGSSSSPTEDTTYDRVFLPSLTEVYAVEQKTEGQAFEYWKRRLGISSPQGWYGDHAMPERICYGVDNHTSPHDVRFRSAHVSLACYAWYAYSTGYVSLSYASYALRSCPVVVL